MPLDSGLTALFSLIFVLCLMGLLALGLKKLGFMGAGVASPLPGTKRRLSVTESLALGPQTRAVILKRDNTEHLVIIGPNGQTVVETGITRNDEHA